MTRLISGMGVLEQTRCSPSHEREIAPKMSHDKESNVFVFSSTRQERSIQKYLGGNPQKSSYQRRNNRRKKYKTIDASVALHTGWTRKGQTYGGNSGDFDVIEIPYYTYYFSPEQELFLKENPFIKPYFKYSPEERIKLSKSFARYIKSVADVLFVLKCGSARDIKEGFDSAIALVAECDASLLIQAIDRVRKWFIDDFEKAKKYEYYWDILILGIACSSHLCPQKKLQVFRSLFVNNLGRATKASLIDALGMLDGKIDSDSLKTSLERFVSSNELDDYIRDYAREAIQDLS